MIAYNYRAYYPWNPQLALLTNWRLIYIDESAALFVRQGYADHLPTVDPSSTAMADEHDQRAQLLAVLKAGKPTKENPVAVKLYNSANDRCQRGDYEGALSDFSKALELEPDYIKALNNRGILLATVFNNFQAAHADFTKILTLDPANSNAWLGRGTAYFLQKMSDSACFNWQKAMQLGNTKAPQLIHAHCNPK